jgi:Transposase DDE domain
MDVGLDMDAVAGEAVGQGPLPPVQGLKYLKRLSSLFSRLHEVGCQRDRAGNRTLHFDQYVQLILLYLFNPLIASLRGLQKTVGLGKVAQTLGIKRFSLGSFSESSAVFDPEHLKPIINELAARVRPLASDPRLAELEHAVTLADGTMLAALPRLAQAAALGTCYAVGRDGRGKFAWRLHTQFDLRLPYPLRIDVTGANASGERSERKMLSRTIESGRTYVTDGGYVDYQFFDDIVEVGSSYVCRVREDSAFTVLEERDLSPQARAQGIVRDMLIKPGQPDSCRRKHPVRMIVIKVTPHLRRSRRVVGSAASHATVKGSRISDTLVIVTSLLGLPAELVALIYRMRYSIELFFRFLKSMLGMRHLLSQRKEGVEIQTGCAVIACLLIHLETGKKPDKRTVEMMGFYLMGLASEEEMLAHLNQKDNKGIKLKACEEMWKKLGL